MHHIIIIIIIMIITTRKISSIIVDPHRSRRRLRRYCQCHAVIIMYQHIIIIIENHHNHYKQHLSAVVIRITWITNPKYQMFIVEDLRERIQSTSVPLPPGLWDCCYKGIPSYFSDHQLRRSHSANLLGCRYCFSVPGYPICKPG